jgi:hypothetical protein
MKRRPLKKVEATYEEIVQRIIQWAGDEHVIVIGPIVWHPVDGAQSAKLWYFTVATKGFRLNRIDCYGNEAEAILQRLQILSMLISKGGIVIHVCEDELKMARLCDALWPSEKSRSLLADMEKSWPAHA